MRFVITLIIALIATMSYSQVGYLYTEVDSVLIGETFDVKMEFSGINPEDIVEINWDTLANLEHVSLVDSQNYNVDFDFEKGKFSGDDFLYSYEEISWDQDDQATPPTFFNTFKFTVWELCILGLPGPEITLKNGSKVLLNARYIFIKDPLMRDVEGLSPSADIIRENVTWMDLVRQHWLLISGILLFLILLPLAVWFSRRERKVVPTEIETQEEVTVPVIPPHIVAMQRLEALKSSRIWEDEDKAFVSELTDIIREYIENRFGVQALEMTTQEIMQTMKSEMIATEHIDQLQKTLNVSDMIKFAKAKADINLYEEFVDDAINLVEKTKVEEPKIEEGDS